MKILMTGASGLIGTSLSQAFAQEGHQIANLRRGNDVPGTKLSWDPDHGRINLCDGEPFDAVIHLAGESVGQRWSVAVKQRIRESRVQGTRLLREALVKLPQPPRVLIGASATGFYGDRGSEWLDEQSSQGRGFLAEVCAEWEAAARPAAERGIRVAHLRFGVVLAKEGGALAKMLPPFRLGLGGRFGDGRQFWSWVAIEDLVRAVQHVLSVETMHGPVNVVSPHPVTNAEFARTLGRVLRRPSIVPVPRFAVELLLGEMGREALLSSFRVKPAQLLESGFQFQFPELEPALRHTVR